MWRRGRGDIPCSGSPSDSDSPVPATPYGAPHWRLFVSPQTFPKRKWRCRSRFLELRFIHPWNCIAEIPLLSLVKTPFRIAGIRTSPLVFGNGVHASRPSGRRPPSFCRLLSGAVGGRSPVRNRCSFRPEDSPWRALKASIAGGPISAEENSESFRRKLGWERGFRSAVCQQRKERRIRWDTSGRSL